MEITKGMDLIVHFAAESHVDRSIEGPEEFVKTNVEGTLNLLEAALQRGGIRFHHISTDEVFGELPLDNPKAKFHEGMPYSPRSVYSASKAASDHLVRAYNATHKLPITISNCSNNYGPYQFPEKLIPLAITRAIMGEEIPVYGEGNQVRDWIHVEDHCKGIELCITKGVIGETYLFGGNGEKPNIWIIKKILEYLNKPESLIVHVGDRKGHDLRYAIDFSKSNKELGYNPTKSVDDWLKDTVDWYVNNQQWWEPLKPKADIQAEKYLEKRI
ncbi:MAG: dtdp-glucose 4,6-dehydratase, dTDP-glucose 4,6-dehydratase [candidate division WS6 bacterium GW2011_GWC1_33_20]|nr:MAG: dtdp-glucose 4,6-dehydratase, dTDP-glucose 4,6-dehydratase [candidate division WS6 bacterium GW2011_GWC1_33_20]KKP44868.1 MAG: dtdp-glucose 4,6-dehydratase, dTDP-glucose 4,6-dehydratase [candidate division WS6 bacterium GW2011_GWF1_33_233]